MEAIDMQEEKFADRLSLEDTVRLYAAVDLLVRHDGRERISEDWTESESFSQDPVAAEAVSAIQQMLNGQAAG